MAEPKLPLVPFHQLDAGVPADTYALLANKLRGITRDNKPYWTCWFRNRYRTATMKVWADAPLFNACETSWAIGGFYKLRGVYKESERYGAEFEAVAVREVRDSDRGEGFNENDLIERSRFDSDELYAELLVIADEQLEDTSLKQLIKNLYQKYEAQLKQLPATANKFFPFPGGWLEHVRNVAKNCLTLTDYYRTLYPELNPPLNRDLILAGALLHELGRVIEYEVPPMPGLPVTVSRAGQLNGHIPLTRDLVRDEARGIENFNPHLLELLEHLLLSYLSIPEWGSQRLPAIPEVLILHHADDLDAKLEMFSRCLIKDMGTGDFTDPDPILKRVLLKKREL